MRNITPAQVTLIKYAAIAGALYWLYSKVTSIGTQVLDTAGEVAGTKLNPMHPDNLANQAAENLIGPDELASASTIFFDWIDTAAEAVGFENGINGIPGTTADAMAAKQQEQGHG